MKFFTTLALVAAVLSVATLVASFPIQSSFESQAVMAQRVLPSEQADLFGDKGEFIGSPQKLIIDDQKAFLSDSGPDGSKLVNEKYLQEHKIYPLQLQTVNASLVYIRIAAVISGLVSGFVFLRLRTKARNP